MLPWYLKKNRCVLSYNFFMQRISDNFLFQISANSHKSIGNRYINSFCWIFMNALCENIHNCTSCLEKSSWARHSSNLTFPTKITLLKVNAYWLIPVSYLNPCLFLYSHCHHWWYLLSSHSLLFSSWYNFLIVLSSNHCFQSSLLTPLYFHLFSNLLGQFIYF